MANNTLDDQVRNKLGSIGKQLGYSVYPSLPSLGTDYPFMTFGEIADSPRATKGPLLGAISVRLHFWGSELQKSEVSLMADKMRAMTRNVQLETLFLMSKINASRKRTLADNSTGSTLWHVVLDLEFTIHY
ncbi:hypothetical protein [Facklamia sp. P12934]|uniref:hypothetical protein n=1 Tax=unclassified Facklamia TaxID=2622293 RepID=UPI003D18475E